MFPRGVFCAHLLALAGAVQKLLAYRDTPDPLRREIKRFYKRLRKKLPRKALREIEAAEARATIIAADHLRRDKDS